MVQAMHRPDAQSRAKPPLGGARCIRHVNSPAGVMVSIYGN